MRIAVVSDVHSNIDALEAVLRDAESVGALDGVWSLGDIVGYGADPRAVIAALRARGTTGVAGNHDLAACGRMGTDEFNPVAAEAVLWTARALGETELGYLRGLPLTRIAGDVTLVHGSLRAPEWEYLLTPEQATAHFALQTTPYSLVGHSHLPFWAEETGSGAAFHPAPHGARLALAGRRLILNPGSIGQPRDGDPRAGYLLYDQDAATVAWRRVAYDIDAAQRRIRAAGLHPWLAERLSEGR